MLGVPGFWSRRFCRQRPLSGSVCGCGAVLGGGFCACAAGCTRCTRCTGRGGCAGHHCGACLRGGSGGCAAAAGGDAGVSADGGAQPAPAGGAAAADRDCAGGQPHGGGISQSHGVVQQQAGREAVGHRAAAAHLRPAAFAHGERAQGRDGGACQCRGGRGHHAQRCSHGLHRPADDAAAPEGLARGAGVAERRRQYRARPDRGRRAQPL